MEENNQNQDSTSLNTELNAQINEAKKIVEILNGLTSNGEIYKGMFEAISKDIKNSYKDITSSKSANTKYNNDLVKSKESIETFLEEIKNVIFDTKVIISNLNEYKKKAQNGLENINTLKNDVTKDKKEVTARKNDVIRLFKKTETIQNNSNTLLLKIEEEKTLSENLLNDLKKIHKACENNSKELANYYKKGKENFERIQKQATNVNKLELDSTKKNSKISEYYNKLFGGDNENSGIKEEINSILTTIKSNQVQIDNQLQNTSANRLCIAFDEEVKSLKKELNSWKNQSFWIAIGLVVLNIFIILLPGIQIEWWQHFGILFPIVIYFGFAILEHARLKKILDEYSFKYISSFSMPAYFDLIETRDEDKSLEFLISSINELYKNPAQNINSKSKDTMIDYIFDFLKNIKSYFTKNNIDIPDINISSNIGDFDLKISNLEKKNNNERVSN